MGASMLAKVIASMSKLLFTFVLFSHGQFAIFRLNAFIFLMELHFVHNYHIQVEQYRLFCSYLFDFVLFSALLFYKDIMYVFLIKYELALDQELVFDQEDPNERPSFDQLLLRMEIMITKDTLYLDLKEDGKK